MGARVQQLVLLLLCSLGLLHLPAGAQLTTSRELYVKPNEDTSCRYKSCRTLDDYVQNASYYFVSNTTLNFLAGNHSLNQSLNVSGVTNLALVAINGTVNITCIINSPVAFANISGLILENLIFSACDTLDLSNVMDLSMHWIDIQPPLYKHEWTLNALNIFGNSSLEGLNVLGHTNATVTANLRYRTNLDYPVPSLSLLVVKDMCVLSSKLELSIEFPQSNFIIDLLIVNLSMSSTEQHDIIVTVVSNTTNTINFKDVGPSSLVVWVVLSPSTQMTIADSELDNAHAESPMYMVIIGLSELNTLEVKNVTFSGFYEVIIIHVANIRITNCKFHGVTGNPARGTLGQTTLLYYSREVYFKNCEFRDNIGTPVDAVDSNFILSGANSFSNNTAYQGGALALYGNSSVLFADRSKTTFSSNSADAWGGAIFVDYLNPNPCFFKLENDYVCSQSFAPNFSLVFDNNHAESGGTKIFGAELDYCHVNTDSYSNGCKGWTFASSVFHDDLVNNSDFSDIASAPRRACLCVNGTPSCTTVFSHYADKVYPGETIEIPAVIVGDRFGTVDGSVYAHLLPQPPGEKVHIEHLQKSQRVEDQKCTNLSYTILCNSETVILVLTTRTLLTEYQYPNPELNNTIQREISEFNATGRIEEKLRSTPVYISITLGRCPMGFKMSGKKPRCICSTELTENSMSCNLATQTVQRSGTEWVNASFENMTYKGVIVSKYCPNNYCKQELVNVNLEHPETQCAYNHSGILCGGCQSNLSLTLGSAQCRKCSNKYLALLIPFALAGFALVFFIKILNLTVAEGTLNGLIFYANIVQANRGVWIAEDNSKVLTAFIAWLNLDLGIETCFFDGLDAHWKTWLQLVFPLYIWAIAVLIIVLSHYFSIAARIFGNNAVQVLATLLFLSYSKLLRTTIVILQFSEIDGHSPSLRWSYDGNTAYFSRRHILLFSVALVIIVFLWLPFTVILTSAQFLQRIPYHCVTKILVKLKPVLDSYHGPLKDRHRYWFGLLLLVRGLLFIFFAVYSSRNPNVSLLLTFTAALALLMYRHIGLVYKKKYLSLLESSFILNLGILAGGTLYINISGGSQTTLAHVSLRIAFVQFVVILAAHAAATFKAFFVRRCQPTTLTPDRAEYEGLVDSPVENAQSFQELVISFDDFREPVLKYCDSET